MAQSAGAGAGAGATEYTDCFTTVGGEMPLTSVLVMKLNNLMVSFG